MIKQVHAFIFPTKTTPSTVYTLKQASEKRASHPIAIDEGGYCQRYRSVILGADMFHFNAIDKNKDKIKNESK